MYEGSSAFGFAGSCTLISYRRKAFVVATRHQVLLPDQDPSSPTFDALRFVSDDGEHMTNILVDECHFEEANPGEEYHELLFFSVQQTWLQSSRDRPYFIPVEGFYDGPRRASLVYGHPLSRTRFAYEPYHTHIAKAVTDVTLDVDFRSHAEHMRLYRYGSSDYEVNGFSGGAVYSLVEDSGFSMVLDGIVVRGGNGHLYIVDSDYLVRAFESFVAQGRR